MAINDAADSGPPQDNAGQGGKESALDRAMAAAWDGTQQTEDDDVPLVLAKDKKDAESNRAGDKSDGEDAPASKRTRVKDGDVAASIPPDGQAAAIEAPKHWPEERRKAFAGWAKEVQSHALAVDKDLQAGFTRKSQELSDQARFGQAVRDLIDGETRQRMQATGLDEVGYVRYLHSLQQAAIREPATYIGWAMRQLGVTPEHLGLTALGQQQQQQMPSTGNPQVDEQLLDPAYKQLRDQLVARDRLLHSLQQRMDAQDRAKRDWEQQRRVEAHNNLDGMWNTFRGTLDDTGQLAFPHADALMAQMGALMETHRALQSMPDGPEKLAKAYQMAVAADPELSKPLIEAEVSKRVAEQERKRDAERAKRAVSVRPATGAPAVPTKKGSGIDGALEAAWDRLANRS